MAVRPTNADRDQNVTANFLQNPFWVGVVVNEVRTTEIDVAHNWRMQSGVARRSGHLLLVVCDMPEAEAQCDSLCEFYASRPSGLTNWICG